jgi:hypothetical protein
MQTPWSSTKKTAIPGHFECAIVLCSSAISAAKAQNASSITKKAKEEFRIGELNPGLVGTDHLSMIESDKS